MTARIEAGPATPLPRNRRARWALVLTAGWLVGGLVAVNGLIEQFAPVAIDPEYVLRRDRLRDRLVDDPDRPTLVVVGSSRVVLGFLPEELPTLTTADGHEVIPFNFAHIGSGPTMNRIVLERLYRDGFRPRGVIIELMPTFLTRESNAYLSMFLDSSEVGCAGRSVGPADLAWKFGRRRVTAFPTFVRTACGVDEPHLECKTPGPLGGCLGLEARIADADRARKTAQQVVYNQVREFRVSPGREAAIRESVALGRSHGAEVRFLLTPEGPGFRPTYAAGARDDFEDFVHRLAADLQVEVIDARDWLTDEDFSDAHHPLAGGASKFTARFGQEVLAPWVAGWNSRYVQSMNRGSRAAR
jgi:hypothetical protein